MYKQVNKKHINLNKTNNTHVNIQIRTKAKTTKKTTGITTTKTSILLLYNVHSVLPTYDSAQPGQFILYTTNELLSGFVLDCELDVFVFYEASK